MKKIEIKELTILETLKLALEYSISKKHQRLLIEKIAKLEGKSLDIDPVKSKPKKNIKSKSEQQSFL